MTNTTDKSSKREIQKLREKIDKLGKSIVKATNLTKKNALKTTRYNLIAQMGELYIEQGALEEAGKIYGSLPWKSHGEVRYYGISRKLVEEKNYEEARILIEEGLGKYPESLQLLNAMGLIFHRTGDQYEALRYFDRALETANNSNTEVLYNKALSLNCLSYHEEAFKILTELLEKTPDDPVNLIEMGYCNLKRKEPWAAIHYYRAAKEMGLESGSVFGGLCCAYVDADLHHEAYMIAYEGVQKLPYDVVMYENLAEAAKDLGKLEEANEVIQKGLALDPEYKPLKILQQDLDLQLDYQLD